MIDSINIEKWDREAKLFAIRGLTQIGAKREHGLLLKLITDPDPVVRGKSALAMEEASDELIKTAVDQLLEVSDPNYTILALELLDMTREIDYTDVLFSLLGDSDPRVIKSAIASLANLPVNKMISVLNSILARYQAQYNEALTRLFIEKNHPELFPVLKEWYDKVETHEQRLNVLRIGACLPLKQAKEWCRKQIKAKAGDKGKVIRWLCQRDERTAR